MRSSATSPIRGATSPASCSRWRLLSFIILLIRNQTVQLIGPFILLIAILAAIVDSIIFGRQIARRVAEKFPKG